MHAFAFLPVSILRPANKRAAVLTSDTMKENLKKENKTFPNFKKKKGMEAGVTAQHSGALTALLRTEFGSPHPHSALYYP